MIDLKLENITIKFSGRKIIDNLSAEFKGGEMTAIIGKNGVGKTTFIKSIAELTKHSGNVNLYCDNKKTESKKNIAYVPQLGSLNTKLTVFEMVLLGLVNNLKWHITNEQLEMVSNTIEELNLTHLSKQPFNTLSGGQKQLVSMAQSMISKPKVLLLDEPTSALDLRHQLIVMNLAQKYTKETGAVTIFVVHDLMLASRYGANLLLLNDGKIKAFDTAEKVLKPEMLESVYGVKISVERTKNGFLSAVPIEPIDI